jgi:phage terminase large subunit-like protein
LKDNYILKYYQGIKDESVIVGSWIKLIYEYIVTGLNSGAFKFNKKKADAAIEWIEKHCRHTEGELAPGLMKLELWQKALISCVFGIVDEKDKRIFREIVLVVARKNGKSLFASAIANYVFFLDGGYGTRIYCLAPKLDQAEIIYSNIWTQISLDKELKQDTKLPVDARPNTARHRMTDLFIESTNSTVKKIAFSAKKSDGFNPSLTICDEIASWGGDQGLKQYEVMKSGMGARPEALLLSISTAGYVNESIYDELIKRATRFLLGDSKEKRLLPFLYMIDDPEKWNDINELQKSNPNLGVSVSVDYLLEEIAIAEGSLSKKAEFLTKYCNIKQNSSLAWLSTETVKKMECEELAPEQFRSSYCVAGIDLSMTTDLTAACVIIEKDDVNYVLAKFWMPAEKLEEATLRDGLPYREYIQKGWLELSGDNFIDYHDCFNWLCSLVDEYEILPLQVGYDRYSSQYLITELNNRGFHCDDVYQGYNLGPVISEMEGKAKDGKLKIGNNDLLKIHLLNAALKHDNESNRTKLVKMAASDHIDGVAAMLDALTVKQKWNSQIGDQLANRS